MANILKQVIDGYNSIWELRGIVNKVKIYLNVLFFNLIFIWKKRYASRGLAFYELSSTYADDVRHFRDDRQSLGTELYEKPTRLSIP